MRSASSTVLTSGGRAAEGWTVPTATIIVDMLSSLPMIGSPLGGGGGGGAEGCV
jgi:hypothetical protein